MWRLPLLNFFLGFVLITFPTLQHSALVFVLAETRYEPVRNDSYRGRFHAESDPAWSGIRLVGGLGAPFGRLHDLWQRSMIIKEWVLEYGTTGWERIDALRGVENDLVEARFHVANAEVFGAATGETQRAKVEIDRADRYLQRAEALIADNALPAVKAIRKELSAARMDLGMAYPEIQASDERIKAELDRLINALHGK